MRPPREAVKQVEMGRPLGTVLKGPVMPAGVLARGARA